MKKDMMKKSLKKIVFIVSFMLACGIFSQNNKVYAEEQGKLIEENGARLYLIGDSRTYLGNRDTQDKRANWLASPGTSFTFFNSEFVPYLNLRYKKDKRIVILYGINDIIGFGEDMSLLLWLNFYNTTAQDWIREGAEIYTCTVFGVEDDLKNVFPDMDIKAVNKKVASFNKQLKDNLPPNIHYIDLAPFTEKPFMDGIHYTSEESFLIYEGLINLLK